MKHFFQFAILLSSLVLSTNVFADVKVKIRQTMSGQTYENTTYIKGKRQRAEQNMGGTQMVTITQCDLKLQNGNSVALTKQFKAKAKSDGEDIISPIIEQAAQAILDSVAK